MLDTENRIAKDLLSIGAVFLRPDEPFTWASKRSDPLFLFAVSRLLQDVVGELSKLPGIGRRTALRLAIHLLRMERCV